MKGRNSLGRFTKEYIESAEIKLKRAKALKEAWLKRSDYIGDLINKHPYVYNVWRGIRFSKKQKTAGCSEDWKDFKNFYNDVIDTYVKGYVFRRKNWNLPHGKNNFMWVSKKDLPLLEAHNSKYLTYQGKTQTIKQWCLELNLNYNGVRQRAYRNKHSYSIEEILFGKLKNRKSKEVKDWKDSKAMIRSKASKMISSYKLKDKKMGLNICDIDIDWMINNIILKPCIYCGDTSRVGCDRIDNDKGHTKSNVVPCCYDCNCARNNNFSFEEMKLLGKTIKEIKNNRLKNNITLKIY